MEISVSLLYNGDKQNLVIFVPLLSFCLRDLYHY